LPKLRKEALSATHDLHEGGFIATDIEAEFELWRVKNKENRSYKHRWIAREKTIPKPRPRLRQGGLRGFIIYGEIQRSPNNEGRGHSFGPQVAALTNGVASAGRL
jgi:hypothetical protein